MAKKEKAPEKRRFDEPDRKPWTEEQRKKYYETRDRIAPIVRDLTTPARDDKPKHRDPLDVLLGVGDNDDD